MSRASPFALLVSAAFLTGCDLMEPKCTLILMPSFDITVVDSVTNAPVTDGLRGRISAGRFSANLTVHQNRLSYIEQYRPDSYDVVIDATGYRTWRKDVRLKMDECHIIPLRFTVKMAR